MADLHPPPWTVCDNVHGGNGVVDAAGVLVIAVDDPWQNLEFMDAYARALVLSAPETKESLRVVTKMLSAYASGDFGTAAEIEAVKTAEALLARLDEARRG